MIAQQEGTYKSDSLIQRLGHQLGRLENWCTFANLAEASLVLINGLLLIKTLANLSAILIEDSDDLILEYNGHLLFDPLFRLTTVLINLLTFLTSLLSLMAILFTGSTRPTINVNHYYGNYGQEYQLKRHRLLKCTTIAQLILASVVLILMGKLWFSPPKIELSETDFGEFIDNYDYHTTTHHHSYKHYHHYEQFENPFDRLQRSLACCGFRSAAEWTDLEAARAGPRQLALLAPSCCSSPLTGPDFRDIPSPASKATEEWSSSRWWPPMGARAAAIINSPSIHYCARLDDTIMRIDSNGLELPVGCQQRLNERDTRFLFALRMRLLILLAALFLMTQVSLTFYLPSICPSSPTSSSSSSSASASSHAQASHRGRPRQWPDGGRGAGVEGISDNRHHLPPDYWNVVGAPNMLVLVDKASASNKVATQIDCEATN